MNQKHIALVLLVLLAVLAGPACAIEYVYTSQNLSMGTLTLQQACQAGWSQNAGTSNPSTESFDIDIYYQGGTVRVARYGPGGAWHYVIPSSSTVYYPTYNYVVQKYSFLCSGGWKSKETVDFFPYLGAKVIGPAGAAPVNFTGSPLEGPPPLSVDFSISNYFATTTRNWSFGDGQYETATSTTTTHNYSSTGTYTVTLTYTNSSGSHQITKTDYISAIDSTPPEPHFECNSMYDSGSPQSPYDLYCWDSGSVVYPAETSHQWRLTQPDSSVISSTNTSLTRELQQIGWYGLDYEICNSMGCGYSNVTELLNVSGIYTTGASVILEVHSSQSPYYPIIAPAETSIRNISSGDYGNATTPFGIIEFVDVGGIDLSQGQTVQLCAGADGYENDGLVCENVEIAYEGYTHSIYLTPTSMIPSAGNWNLNVKTLSNLNHEPISAQVEVITGVSGGGSYVGGTDASTGMVSFKNISASATALITVTAQAYQSAQKIVTVFPNTTQTVTFELVRIGQTPVETPIQPTVTTTYDPPVVPVPTDPYTGEPITEPDQYLDFTIIEMVKMLPVWIKLFIGIVTMALLWGALYWTRGGKYRKKGRGGWI